MKYLLFAFALLLSSLAQSQPSIKASIDSLSVAYAPCLRETIERQIVITNDGDSTSVTVQLSNDKAHWRWAPLTWMTHYPVAKGRELLLYVAHYDHQTWSGDLRDTLLIMQEKDTLRIPLAARAKFGILRLDEYKPNFGEVRLGDTARGQITLYNDGDADLVIERVPEGDWFFRDLHRGDTIHQGSSRTAELISGATWMIGPQDTTIKVRTSCFEFAITPRMRVYDPSIHLSVYEIRDTISGCPNSVKTYSFALSNESDSVVKIDSIRFEPYGNLNWTLETGELQGDLLQPGATLPISLTSTSTSAPTSVTIYPNGRASDRVTVDVVVGFTDPSIRNYRDTLVVDLKPGEKINLGIQVQNRGVGRYRVQKIEMSGDPLWSYFDFDTNQTVGYTRSIALAFPFAGAPAGVYTATAYIQGAPCDTILKQVLVARVGQASVDQELSEEKLRLIRAAQGLDIIFDRAFTYSLFDIRGSLVLTGDSPTRSTSIDLRAVPPGSYLIRLEAGDFSITRKIAW